ncbi:COG4705 family protein [Luethyella okanaganae]|uniref:Membrane-anchored protein n=1 Tax=Luethyella okanaganae TaxID=69372 RepID=A0ABW1VGF6_9MICO
MTIPHENTRPAPTSAPMQPSESERRTARADVTARMLNKVPQVTIFFWIVKILSTTVGETGADLLSSSLHWGLTITTWVMTGILLVALVIQFRTRRYVPSAYWFTVVLVSIVGTLFTDNLVDHLGVPLLTATILFAVALGATFIAWFAAERTLSIHTIVTTRRETFYWLAILFTFALGTAAGDFLAEGLDLGYSVAGLVFAGMIVLVAIAHYVFRMNGVVSFWLAYILTRPLGASLGDYLSQSQRNGGLGLGTIGTSAVFLTVIVVVVASFTVIERRAHAVRKTSRPVALRDGASLAEG